MKRSALLLATALVFTITACSTDEDPPTPASTSTKKQDSTDDDDTKKDDTKDNEVSLAQYANVPMTLSERTLDLAASIETTENVVISPASLAWVFAMMSDGAKCETREELNAFLGVDDADRVATYRFLAETYSSHNESGTSNAIAVNDAAEGLDHDMIADLAERYGADVFEGDVDALNAELSDWIGEATHGRQESLPESLNDATEVAFANGLYIRSDFGQPAGTTTLDFTTASGEVSNVDAISFHETLNAIKTSNGYTVQLPTDDGEPLLFAYLPDEGVSLTDTTASDLVGDGVDRVEANVVVPMLDTSYELNVMSHLDDLGLASFEDTSDGCGFSGFTSDGHALSPTMIIQKAEIELDENGLEGSAVTISSMDGSAPGQDMPIQLEFNRPFVLSALDPETLLPVFISYINDPKI